MAGEKDKMHIVETTAHNNRLLNERRCARYREKVIQRKPLANEYARACANYFHTLCTRRLKLPAQILSYSFKFGSLNNQFPKRKFSSCIFSI